MPEDSGKFAEKIGAFAAPGAQVNIGTQIINGQKQLTHTKFIPCDSLYFVGRETELTMLHQNLQRVCPNLNSDVNSTVFPAVAIR